MEEQKVLEWITDVFAVKGRVVRIQESRESIPEWDSLGGLVLQSRLKDDHGITVADDEIARLETVQEIVQIFERESGSGPRRPQTSKAPGENGPRPETPSPKARRRRGGLSGTGRDLLRRLSPRQRSVLRRAYGQLGVRRIHRQLVDTFRSYGPEELLEALRSLGVRAGDTVLVHSAFEYTNGFSAGPEKAIDVFLESVGPDGNLLMLSLPYNSSTYKYLQTLDRFDVRKTVSQMGLLTEIFRERSDVVRSLSPTHPFLAHGPRADWIVAGHENCPYPCGKGTPFEKLIELEGKVVFFDAGFVTLTFFHYIEDMVKDQLPQSLYHPEAFEVPVIDREGRQHTVFVYAFSPAIIKRRKPYEFETEVRKAGLINSAKIGNTQLQYIEITPLMDYVNGRLGRGDLFFYDLS
jgi:aminoglycoside N3'-acetyltransferase/acyl carrier protein